jgi:hypothetical protein
MACLSWPNLKLGIHSDLERCDSATCGWEIGPTSVLALPHPTPHGVVQESLLRDASQSDCIPGHSRLTKCGVVVVLFLFAISTKCTLAVALLFLAIATKCDVMVALLLFAIAAFGETRVALLLFPIATLASPNAAIVVALLIFAMTARCIVVALLLFAIATFKIMDAGAIPHVRDHVHTVRHSPHLHLRLCAIYSGLSWATYEVATLPIRPAWQHSFVSLSFLALGYACFVLAILVFGATLHKAAGAGHVGIVRLLVRLGADPSQRMGRTGRTPLHTAALAGDVNAVRALVDLAADISACDAHGASPLHWAAAQGHEDAIRILVQLRADPNALMKDGSSPIFSTAQRGHEEALLALVELGGNAVTPDGHGVTPMEVAYTNGHAAVVCALFLVGADPLPFFAHSHKSWRDFQGCFPDERRCAACFAPAHLACSRCWVTHYCGETCQRSNFASHRLLCIEYEKQ